MSWDVSCHCFSTPFSACFWAAYLLVLVLNVSQNCPGRMRLKYSKGVAPTGKSWVTPTLMPSSSNPEKLFAGVTGPVRSHHFLFLMSFSVVFDVVWAQQQRVELYCCPPNFHCYVVHCPNWTRTSPKVDRCSQQDQDRHQIHLLCHLSAPN